MNGIFAHEIPIQRLLLHELVIARLQIFHEEDSVCIRGEPFTKLFSIFFLKVEGDAFKLLPFFSYFEDPDRSRRLVIFKRQLQVLRLAFDDLECERLTFQIMSFRCLCLNQFIASRSQVIDDQFSILVGCQIVSAFIHIHPDELEDGILECGSIFTHLRQLDAASDDVIGHGDGGGFGLVLLDGDLIFFA